MTRKIVIPGEVIEKIAEQIKEKGIKLKEIE